MINNQKSNMKYDLEERTLIFAKQIVKLCKQLPNNTVNFKLVDQLIRSAGSIGANYREANDSLGKKILHLESESPEKKPTPKLK
jgi:hypothetical protein